MKTKLNTLLDSWLILAGFVVLLTSGCGMQDSLDKTKKLTSDTKDGVLYGNELQELMLEAIRKGNSIQELIALLNEKIKEGVLKTKEAVHLQILGNALSQLFDPNNTQNLTPPTKMIPPGQAFANEAVADEIASLAHLLYSDANYSDGGISSKRISLVAMGVIAGFTSLDKMKSILKTQVEEKGLYEEATYAFAMTRYILIRDLLFLPYIEKAKYLNKTILKLVAEHHRSLKHLATLSYVDRVELDIPSLFYSQRLSPNEHVTLGRRAKTKFQSKLSPSELADPEVQKLLQEIGA